jgi:hypothetical protein
MSRAFVNESGSWEFCTKVHDVCWLAKEDGSCPLEKCERSNLGNTVHVCAESKVSPAAGASMAMTFNSFPVVEEESLPLSVPANMKGKPTRSIISINWNKVTEASGYEVSIFHPPYLRDLSHLTNLLSCQFTGLTANTSYRFRVRAYRLKNSVYYFGPWSKLLYVKTLS